jgi:hypothetical protein
MPYKDPITRVFVQIENENLHILDLIARAEGKQRGAILRELVNGMLSNAREVLAHKDFDSIVSSALDVVNKCSDEMKRELFSYQRDKKKVTLKTCND